MKNYKYIKPNFITFSVLTLISNGLIYILQFYLQKEIVNYYLCTEIKSYSLTILSRNLDLIYPESCDLKVYAEGVINIFSFYNLNEFVYLDRPLFVLYIAIIYNVLSFLNFYFLDSLVILKASFFIGQVFLTSIISIYILKILNLANLEIGNKYITLPWLIAISPMFKWHIFESTSMTFTFLIFLLGIFIYLKNNNINLNLYFFIVGLIFLIHRSALLILVFFILVSTISKNLTKEKIKSTLYFFIPIILYYLSIFTFSSFSDHQAEEYRQFIWILDFLQGKETRIGGYFCQTPVLAMKCYLNDLIKLTKYLAFPILMCLLYFIFNFNKLHNSIKSILFSGILFSLVINIFWSFIGWYPPVRFSYYGFGNLIIFLLILMYFNFQSIFARITYFFGITFNFIFLNHWNSPLVIEHSLFTRISILLFIGSLIIENYPNRFKV